MQRGLLVLYIFLFAGFFITNCYHYLIHPNLKRIKLKYNLFFSLFYFLFHVLFLPSVLQYLNVSNHSAGAIQERKYEESMSWDEFAKLKLSEHHKVNSESSFHLFHA